MKTIWTIIGVIVLIAIIVVFYRMATNKKTTVMPKIPVINPVDSNSNTNKTETVTEKQTIIVPVVVKNSADCGQAYQDNVLALHDTYMQKRVIYQTAIKNNDPNVIQYHKDMNIAYQAYYDQASKCNFFIR